VATKGAKAAARAVVERAEEATVGVARAVAAGAVVVKVGAARAVWETVEEATAAVERAAAMMAAEATEAEAR